MVRAMLYVVAGAVAIAAALAWTVRRCTPTNDRPTDAGRGAEPWIATRRIDPEDFLHRAQRR